MKKIAFIGCGNMGGAIVRGVCATVEPKTVYLSNRSRSKAEQLAESCRCNVCEDNCAAAKDADYIFLGVKPWQVPDVIKEISGVLKGNEIIVSMAAGVPGSVMAALLSKTGNGVIRIMPNTPCAIGEGLVIISAYEGVSEESVKELESILSGCGMIGRCSEEQAEAAMTVGGCTPAFTYMFIEALADGGVRAGIKRGDAMLWAAQAVAGAAKLVMESGEHPGALKDAVCSPGGATIEGIRTLEMNAFRGGVMDAVLVAAKRSKELG
ncbi:MAG: pyrroline-5-carboxylate reductase [Ruminococcaceae bacterium]|nr:pyrroline-5-carboxylate reductase [Oscillospiraceae bacterium]